jgi:PAS domain S-box-containing protein
MKDTNKTKEKLIKELQELKDKYNFLKASGKKENIKPWSIEENEKEYVDFLQNIIASFSHPFYVIDADNYAVILANSHTDAYIRGKTTCYQLTHKRDTPCNGIDHPCTVELVKSTGKSVVLEHIHYDSNNNKRNVEIHAHPVFDNNGNIHRIIEYVIDITDRKKAEDNLTGLKKAICASSDSFFLTNLDGIITFVNPGFTALYGYTAEEVVGKVTPRILKSGTLPQSVYEQFWQTLLKKEEVRGEIMNKRKDGSLVEIEATANSIFDENNNIIGFLSIQRDISLRKQNEQIIQQQNQVLHELNATKDKFFSIIAHDLRSPFNTIIKSGDMLMENIDKYDKKEIKTYVKYINNAANETFKLLENLLEWARLQQGMINPEIKSYNFKIIVYEICLLYSETAAVKNITLQNNIKQDIFIKCDREMTKTVLRNLISNAIKFSEKNGIISINAKQQNSVLEVQIKDNGIGIPPDKIPHLFSIDKNVSTPGTAGEKGTGLGLILCKELIEKQGGKIWVESNPDSDRDGKATTFHFTLNKSEDENMNSSV